MDYVDIYQVHRHDDTTPIEETLEAVEKVAADRGVPMAQVALAWMLSKPHVTTPILGASKLSHLDDAIAALDLDLSDEEVAALEAPYRPHPVRGHD